MSISLSAILLFATTQVTFAQNTTLSLDEEKDMNEMVSTSVLLLKENRFEEALPYLNKLLEFEPNNVSLLLNKGSVLIALDRSDEAITYFDKLLKTEPNNINALASKAAALSNIGETQNALDLYDKVISMEKNDEENWN